LVGSRASAGERLNALVARFRLLIELCVAGQEARVDLRNRSHETDPSGDSALLLLDVTDLPDAITARRQTPS
jgi:hypothetical protein